MVALPVFWRRDGSHAPLSPHFRGERVGVRGSRLVATTDAGIPGDAWDVFFDDGYVDTNNKTNINYARAVRGG